jgi:hypothetical protein
MFQEVQASLIVATETDGTPDPMDQVSAESAARHDIATTGENNKKMIQYYEDANGEKFISFAFLGIQQVSRVSSSSNGTSGESRAAKNARCRWNMGKLKFLSHVTEEEIQAADKKYRSNFSCVPKGETMNLKDNVMRQAQHVRNKKAESFSKVGRSMESALTEKIDEVTTRDFEKLVGKPIGASNSSAYPKAAMGAAFSASEVAMQSGTLTQKPETKPCIAYGEYIRENFNELKAKKYLQWQPTDNIRVHFTYIPEEGIVRVEQWKNGERHRKLTQRVQ